MIKKYLLIFLFINPPAHSTDKAKKQLNQSIKAISQTHKEGKNSQDKINRWDDERQRKLTLYKTTLKKTENLKIYNAQLSKYIQAQKEEMLDIRKKIEQVKDVRKEIVPLMLRMLESLDNFVELDTPFLVEKRRERITELKDILSRSDVSVSEKYRQLISSYQQEQEYGRTLQTYREIRDIKGKKVTVDYLRLGRLVLIYKSLDGKYMGYWDKNTGQWKDLSKSYKKSVEKAIKMANKQIPPDLVRLPISPSTHFLRN